MSKLLDKLWTYFRHISLNWTSFECLCISVQNMLTRIQNVGHILDIISYFEHLLDIFWTFCTKMCPNLLVWAHLGHILDTLCENVSKKCPSLHRAGAPSFPLPQIRSDPLLAGLPLNLHIRLSDPTLAFSASSLVPSRLRNFGNRSEFGILWSFSQSKLLISTNNQQIRHHAVPSKRGVFVWISISVMSDIGWVYSTQRTS